MTRNKILLGLTAALMMSVPTAVSGNELTVGNCMSDILYGNEPNMADGSPGGPEEQEPGTQAGNVLPSQSPGPFVNNPTDPDNPTRGRSSGAWMQEGVDIPALCRAAFQ